MTKSEVRRLYRQQRAALSPADWAQRCEAIAHHFIHWLGDWKGKRVDPLRLHLFLPIERQNEVDTWPIIQRLWQECPTVQIAVPVTDLVDRRMTHYSINPGTRFDVNRYGIPEPCPLPASPLSSDGFDLVLVPLLAFDQQGQRVGYGGGFYDRFLAECRPDCLKIGLSLFEPVESIQDTHAGDIPLNLCITPLSIHHFNNI